MGSSEPEFTGRTEGSTKRNNTHQDTTHKKEKKGREVTLRKEAPEANA
jgi:hypothetical protein